MLQLRQADEKAVALYAGDERAKCGTQGIASEIEIRGDTRWQPRLRAFEAETQPGTEKQRQQELQPAPGQAA